MMNNLHSHASPTCKRFNAPWLKRARRGLTPRKRVNSDSWKMSRKTTKGLASCPHRRFQTTPPTNRFILASDDAGRYGPRELSNWSFNAGIKANLPASNQRRRQVRPHLATMFENNSTATTRYSPSSLERERSAQRRKSCSRLDHPSNRPRIPETQLLTHETASFCIDAKRAVKMRFYTIVVLSPM